MLAMCALDCLKRPDALANTAELAELVESCCCIAEMQPKLEAMALA